ncbi:MAG TPA: phosphotransferase [Mycobacterium sp.]
MASSPMDGLDLAALDGYLNSVDIGRDGELHAQLISGGRSNLTFLVDDDSSRWVLRRPPLHGLTPSAHDMAREYRVVAALPTPPCRWRGRSRCATTTRCSVRRSRWSNTSLGR